MDQPASAVRAQTLHVGLSFAVFLAAFYVAYRYGMSFSQASASPFWFPDSVLLCALLMTPPRQWGWYVMAALPIRVFSEVAHDIPLWFLLATFVIDSAKCVLAAVLLRRFVGTPLRLDSVPRFAWFVLHAVLLVPALGAVAGAGARHLLGDPFWISWDQWFMGNALAHLIVTPAICYWVFGSDLRTLLLDTRRLIEAGLLLTGLLITSYVAANTGEGSIELQQTRFYLPIPFLVWAALRFGMFGASGSITVLAVMMIQAALAYRGPFADLSPTDTAHALQNYLLLRAAPLYLVAVVVEQRWHTERSLRESEERFRSIANAAPVMIWQVDAGQRNEFSNEGWLAFSGRSPDDSRHERWGERVHPDDRPRLRELFDTSFRLRQRFDAEYRHRRHDGEYRWVHTTGVPRYAPDGEFLGFIGAVTDVTDRRRAAEATRALAHAQRLAVMGELTAMIAHEIRQPLSAILLSADAARNLLQRPDPPIDELIGIMGSIRQYDLRADDTIRSIRAFVRNQPMQRSALDVNTAVREVCRLLAGDLERRRVRLHEELAADLPPVLGDATQLQQVLVNLIVNAMDAETDVPEADRQVTVSTRRHETLGVEVSVRDCGCGIPAERMPLLFESFFTTNQRGMGLGLSIARTIIAAHDGRIWAANNADAGATFSFTVPVAGAEEDATAEIT
ncbi:MASE1 domain-containing protein [Povalibacter sp.]|uniref:MASE1 domain-containing protein n=1 Tax=Povalibacter sp. TaxID=1962978 RepID=UPI002D1F9B50|nr:MASE1 domain-containing protein [Povalibacter sp.]